MQRPLVVSCSLLQSLTIEKNSVELLRVWRRAPITDPSGNQRDEFISQSESLERYLLDRAHTKRSGKTMTGD